MKRYIVILILLSVSQLLPAQDRYMAMLRAASLSERGEESEAVALISPVIVEGTDAGLLLQRGELYLKMSQIKDARKDFMAAENISPGEGLYGLAKCAAAESDARAATAYLETHLKSQYRKSEPEIMLDDAFQSITTTAEWRNLWRRDWYKGYERKTWEIENYLRNGRTDLAEETLNDLKAEYADMPVTDFCTALLLTDKGEYDEASSLLTPLTLTPDAPAKYIMALAASRSGEGDYYGAASLYGRLIAMEYPNARLYLWRAEMLLLAGDRNPAKNDIKKYLEIDPEDFEALSMLGKTYAEEGAIYEALPYLNTNIEKHPGEAGAFSLRGDAWLASRSWTKATEDYTMSLDLDPNSASVNLNMGISLINSGRAGDACYYLRKARALGDKTATQYLSKYCIK